MEVEEASPDWLVRFRKTHGRAPRILHIGNIANNAYLNARILNERGLDCHVACCDYYHIMGCPEWEDAPLGPFSGDDAAPFWGDAELDGWERPRWFAQGPRFLCLAYLLAICTERAERSNRLWDYLEVCRALYATGPTAIPRSTLMASFPWLRGPARRVSSWFRSLRDVSANTVSSGTGSPRFSSLFAALRSFARTLFRVLRAVDKVRDFFRSSVEDKVLARHYAEAFPGSTPLPGQKDLRDHQGLRRAWSKVLRHYDAVIGYATDGVIPLVCRKHPYIAYEHGTIRKLPFDDSPSGRACAVTYKFADATLITNCDNVVAAKRLELNNYRFVPHPVNETGHDPRRSEELRESLQDGLACEFLVFHPSRQHWEERRHPDWEKGNDIFIRGFAALVQEIGDDAGAILVEWGQTVEESRRLIAELGISDRVHWVRPLPNRLMVEHIRACDVLADQFYLGAFGSTTPKALLHGTPAMLYLEADQHRWSFPELPPVINARTPDQVRKGLRDLYKDPAMAADLSRRGREWYERYHSNDIVAKVLLETLEETFESTGSLSP